MTPLEYLDGLTAEAGSDPSLLREPADAYERVGDVQGGPRVANLGQPSAATESYERALAVRTRLASRDAGDVELRRGLARVRVKRADLLMGQGRFPEALPELRAALEAARALGQRPGREESDLELLADAWGALGAAQARLNNIAAAVDSFRAGLAVAEAWRDAYSGGRARRAVSLAQARLGNTLAERGALVEGIAHLERAVALAEQAARERPDDREVLRDVRVLNAWLGNVLGVPAFVNRGDISGARARYEGAFAAAEALVARDPSDAQAALGLSIVCWRLGSLETERDPRSARRSSERALAILDKLLEENAHLAERRQSNIAVRSSRRAILRQLGAARLRRGQPLAALAEGHAGIAAAHASLAADASLPGLARRDHASRAELHQRKRLTLWETWVMRVPEAPYGEEQRAAATADLGAARSLARRLQPTPS